MPGRDPRQWRVLVTIEIPACGFGFRGTECEASPLHIEAVTGAPPGFHWFNIMIDARLNATQFENHARLVVAMLHRCVNEGTVSRFYVIDGNQWLLDRYCA